ncbi:MAG: glycosyltransferase family 2 protein [Flavobacteriales bacterium]|nr:glycosyltransferase family 2 protein [Flavobacteriales bacterium]
MSIAIVIPTFNRKNHLRKLLENLAQQVGVKEMYQIVVVVDGSTDGTTEMLSNEFPDTHVVNGTGQWFWTKSLNEGIKFAKSLGCKGVLHLNDDLTVPETYLSALEISVAAHPDTIIGSLCLTAEKHPRIFFAGVERINWCTTRRKHYFKTFSPYDESVHKGTRPSCELPGRGMYLPTSVIEKTGLLDEVRFPQYKSDTDLTLTAVERNIKVIIDYDLVLYNQVDLTGAGASFKKEPIVQFIRGFKGVHAHNSLICDWRFYKKHSKCFFIWSFMISNLRKVGTYFRVNLFS